MVAGQSMHYVLSEKKIPSFVPEFSLMPQIECLPALSLLLLLLGLAQVQLYRHQKYKSNEAEFRYRLQRCRKILGHFSKSFFSLLFESSNQLTLSTP